MMMMIHESSGWRLLKIGVTVLTKWLIMKLWRRSNIFITWVELSVLCGVVL